MQLFITRVIKYLLATLLLAYSIIWICIQIKPAYFLGSTGDYYFSSYQYRQVEKRSAYRNIIIGDSRGNAAIYPEYLGRNWINLSIPGTDFFEGYLTLKRFLLQNETDTLVMVYGLDYMEEKAMFFNIRTIPFRYPDWRDLNDLERLERKYGYSFHDSVATSKIQLAIRQTIRKGRWLHLPFTFRATFLDGLKLWVLAGSGLEGKKEEIEKQLKENRGYFNFGEADSCNTNCIGNRNEIFKPGPINLDYLDSIIKLCSQKNISTFLVIPPMNEASWLVYSHSQYEQSVNRFLDSIQYAYPSLHLLYNPVYLPNTLFGDSTPHLNKKGALEFTRMFRDNSKLR